MTDDIKKLLAQRAGVSLEELERRAAQVTKRTAIVAADERAAAHLATSVRFEGAEPLARDELESIVEAVGRLPTPLPVQGVFDPATWMLPSAQIIRGSIRLDTLHLPGECSNLIVDGDLEITGLLQQDFRAGGLLVRGALRAHHLVTTAEIAVTGAMTVTGTCFGNCTNYTTNVWGPARIGTLISAKEHYFSFWGGLEAERILDTEGTPNLVARAHALYDAVDGLLAEDVDLYDEDGVAEVLLARGTLLRPDVRGQG